MADVSQQLRYKTSIGRRPLSENKHWLGTPGHGGVGDPQTGQTVFVIHNQGLCS